MEELSFSSIEQEPELTIEEYGYKKQEKVGEGTFGVVYRGVTASEF